MKKELELKEGPEVNIHLDSLRATLYKIPNWKKPGYDDIYWFWFKKLPPSTTNWICNRINAFKKEAYLNGWWKENLPLSKRTLEKRPYPATIDLWCEKFWLHRWEKNLLLTCRLWTIPRRKKDATERPWQQITYYMTSISSKKQKWSGKT